MLYDNRLFRCVSTHTSAVDFATDANYWLAIGSRLEVWKQNVHYKVEDVIINNNKLYRCIIEHTSTTTFDGTKWNEISPVIIELWQPSTDYKVGNVVIKDNQIYRCNTTHTSLGTFELDKSNWDVLNANTRKWVSGNSYKTGDLVEYNEKLYRCQSDTDDSTFINSEWKEVSKCNIELWRSAPNTDYLGIFKFDQADAPFYNSVETSSYSITHGGSGLGSGKFGKGLSIYTAINPSTTGTDFRGFVTDPLTFTAGTEVYTLEYWSYVNNYYNMAGIVPNPYFALASECGGTTVDFANYKLVFNSGSNSSNIPCNKWVHLAFIIDSNNIELFIDGVSDGTFVRNDPGGNIVFYAPNGNALSSMTSRLDELYISTGAKYTSNFDIDKWYPVDYNVYGYKTNDLVVYEDKIYRALEDNNDLVFTPSKWVEVSSANTSLWESNIYYAVGDIVIYDGQTYRCITAHTSNTFLGDIANWQSLDTNWLVNDWGANKLYLENQVVSYGDSLWKCLATHESASGDSPSASVLYTSSTNVIDINGTTTIPYSETIDLGSVKKVTDFTYNEVTIDMSFTYTIETSEDNVTFTPWNNIKTNARYLKLTVDTVNIVTGATAPNAYLDNFTVIGESDNWEKISSGSTNISLATTSAINAMFI